MTHDRPYRAARTVEQALEELDGWSSRQYDPELVRLLVAYVQTAHRAAQGL